MQARGLLMIEHRLIERMIALFKDVLVKIQSAGRIDPAFIDVSVDFMQTYADQTHHGKEEDILFRDLDKRSLSTDHRRLMNELIEDHVVGRQLIKVLVEANTRYRNGDETALSIIAGNFRMLVNMYQKHIEKEDKVFFPATRAYFSDEEDQAMAAKFLDFDRKVIHEKYKAVVEGLEKTK